jgi:hypothetical protein
MQARQGRADFSPKVRAPKQLIETEETNEPELQHSKGQFTEICAARYTSRISFIYGLFSDAVPQNT